ncbi:unnamed protein product [Dovyalis caffra]|uniref:Secreted protein n=1 Tax=Dovyalis caffra TaxID=77055 RepID=A0AAV1SJK9_9ROSI|nr:unnamed protein product [Dovyalis caffra]
MLPHVPVLRQADVRPRPLRVLLCVGLLMARYLLDYGLGRIGGVRLVGGMVRPGPTFLLPIGSMPSRRCLLPLARYFSFFCHAVSSLVQLR